MFAFPGGCDHHRKEQPDLRSEHPSGSQNPPELKTGIRTQKSTTKSRPRQARLPRTYQRSQKVLLGHASKVC